MRYSLEQRIFLYDTYVKYCIHIASLFTCLISIIFVFRSSCFFGTGRIREAKCRSAGESAEGSRLPCCRIYRAFGCSYKRNTLYYVEIPEGMESVAGDPRLVALVILVGRLPLIQTRFGMSTSSDSHSPMP